MRSPGTARSPISWCAGLVAALVPVLCADGAWAVPAREAGPADGGRRCTITGTARADVLRGTRRADVICGRGGDDRILGGRGDDRLRGGAGEDRIDGGAGGDRLGGGAGGDRLAGGPDRDRVRGGRGRDRFYVQDGARDVVSGGRGRDTVLATDRGEESVRSAREDDPPPLAPGQSCATTAGSPVWCQAEGGFGNVTENSTATFMAHYSGPCDQWGALTYVGRHDGSDFVYLYQDTPVTVVLGAGHWNDIRELQFGFGHEPNPSCVGTVTLTYLAPSG